MSSASRRYKSEKKILNELYLRSFKLTRKNMTLKAYRKEKRRIGREKRERRKDIKVFRSEYYCDIEIKKNVDYFRSRR